MKLVSRSSFGWPSTSGGGSANPRNGLVVHYDGSNQNLAGRGHAACRAYWQQTRRFHMGPSRRWQDIGYAWGCCPHGYVFTGRGLNRSQAAQPGGNSTWYSVSFMSGPSETPTAAQVTAFRQLRAYLMNRGVAGAVSYHGRFISTSCPGSILRSMVTSGALVKGATGGGGGSAPPPSDGGARVLRQGASGADVAAIQAQLVALGYDLGATGADGQFGPATDAAVRAFQRSAGLAVDGAVGPATRAALAAAAEEQEKDMPDHNRYWTNKRQSLPRDRWVQVEFEGSSTQPKAGGGLYTVAFGDVQYSVSHDVRVSGLATGDEYQTRVAEYEQKDGSWTRVRARGIREHFQGGGDAYNGSAQNGRLSGKRRLRLEIKQWTSDEAALEWAEVDPLTWKK